MNQFGKLSKLLGWAVFTTGLTVSAWAEETIESLRSPAPDGATVYFIEPSDGAIVSPEFSVKFGLRNMGVSPAGIEKAETGHHHILIDLDELPDMQFPLPATANIKHFGGGQTETVLKLPPGTHRLQLLLANHLHIPHRPPVMSEAITITVKAGESHEDHQH